MAVEITGVGSYIPKNVRRNEDFLEHVFLDTKGNPFPSNNSVIIEKFKNITGIGERRYANEEHCTSDLGFFAAEKAISDAKIDPETIDYLIVAHNFGDVKHQSTQSDLLPSIASRIKHKLRINNPKCVAYDILFGCPGWIEGVIQAHAFIKSEIAKTCLIIGAETLSRVVDKHDRDSMIYSDGAGAVIIKNLEGESGIIAQDSGSYTYDEAYYLYFGKSNKLEPTSHLSYLKMEGRKIYEFALSHVPQAMKSCLDKSGVAIEDLKKIFIHQANEKMDEAILKRFYKLYHKTPPEYIMPMTINTLGNSSVATVPTLYDLVKNNKMPNHKISKGDHIMFASVGGGMHINCIVYKC